MWIHGFLFYSVYYNLWLSLLIWLLKFPVWPVEFHSSWVLHPFKMFLLFLSVTRCFSLILYFPCPTPEINYLPRSSGFFYWRMVLRNQDMSSRCVHCYWDVTTPTSSWWTEPGNVCVYIHTFIFISVCIKDHEFVLIVIQHYSFHSNFLPFRSCMSLLQMVPAILILFTYLTNPSAQLISYRLSLLQSRWYPHSFWIPTPCAGPPPVWTPLHSAVSWIPQNWASATHKYSPEGCAWGLRAPARHPSSLWSFSESPL